MALLIKEMEDYEGAERYARRCTELDPGNEEHLLLLADILGLMGEDEQAVQAYQEALALDPDLKRARLVLTTLLIKAERYPEVLAHLDRLTEQDPDLVIAHYYRGRVFLEMGDHARAEEALDHFRAIPGDSEYYLNAQMHIAYILDSRDKPAEAEKVLREALAKNRDKSEIYLMLASTLEGREKYEEAREVLERCLGRHPDNAEMVFRLGVILDKSGQRDVSIEQMRRVLEIQPDHADALNYIGYTYAEKGIRLNEALDLITHALKL